MGNPSSPGRLFREELPVVPRLPAEVAAPVERQLMHLCCRPIFGKPLKVHDTEVRSRQRSLGDQDSEPVNHVIAVGLDNELVVALGHHLDELPLGLTGECALQVADAGKACHREHPLEL